MAPLEILDSVTFINVYTLIREPYFSNSVNSVSKWVQLVDLYEYIVTKHTKTLF